MMQFLITAATMLNPTASQKKSDAVDVTQSTTRWETVGDVLRDAAEAETNVQKAAEKKESKHLHKKRKDKNGHGVVDNSFYGATKAESCDTLADVDFNMPEMRPCDGICRNIMEATDARIFSACNHAICYDCMAELTSILTDAGKETCPVGSCRYGNVSRNKISMDEYTFIKDVIMLKHRHDLGEHDFVPQHCQKLTNSESEVSMTLTLNDFNHASLSDLSGEEQVSTSFNESTQLGSWIELSSREEASESVSMESDDDTHAMLTTNYPSGYDLFSLPTTTCSTCLAEPRDAVKHEEDDDKGYSSYSSADFEVLSSPSTAADNSKYYTAFDKTMLPSTRQAPRDGQRAVPADACLQKPLPVNVQDYDVELIEQLQMLSCRTAVGFEQYWEQVYSHLSDCETALTLDFDNSNFGY